MPWIFGFGSLMWNPGFGYIRRSVAVLPGYHRDFNSSFTRVWGSRQDPCPVLGLEPGGQCVGVAYEIESTREEEIIGQLREFEGSGFELKKLKILVDGDEVEATVAMNTRHPMYYLGGLSVWQRAVMASHAEGEEGTCLGYLKRIAEELRKMSVEDEHVDRFLALVKKELA
ncbi:MAG: gamma-glutamylcyclotransferase [Thermoplasmata archaeon]